MCMPKKRQKKKRKSEGVVNSLALLTNEAFQVMHTLQLHILCVLYWPGMLEPALHLVYVRPPGAPRGTQLPVRVGFPRLMYISKKKKARVSYLVQRQTDAGLYIYAYVISSLKLEWLYPYSVCRKLSAICHILNFCLHRLREC